MKQPDRNHYSLRDRGLVGWTELRWRMSITFVKETFGRLVASIRFLEELREHAKVPFSRTNP